MRSMCISYPRTEEEYSCTIQNTIQKISVSSGDRAWEFRQDQKINSKQSSGFLALI